MQPTRWLQRGLHRAIVVICAIAGCGADPLSSGDQLAVTGGQLDDGDPAVGAVLARQATCGEPRATACSGTLIAPRIVLTAAHCEQSPETLEVFFGANVDATADARVDVQMVFVHPAFDPFTKENDLALLLLAETVAIEPVPLETDPLDATDVGTEVRVVGFGADDDGVLGEKREGTATISEVSAMRFEIAPGPAMTCAGDSGGPVFVRHGSVDRLAGVTSGGDPACTSSGDNVRVDAYLDSFVNPGVAILESVAVPEARAPIDPAVDYCARLCAADGDCPRAMTCATSDDGESRCSFFGMFGRFASECSGESDCASWMCVDGDYLGDGTCRCFEPCEVAVDAGAECPPDNGDGGCCGAAGQPLDALAGLVLVLLLLWRRP